MVPNARHQTEVFIQEIIQELRKPRVFEGGSSDLLLPVVHHNPPPVLVVVVLVEFSSFHARILQLISECTQDSLEGVSDKYYSRSFCSELRIGIPGVKVAKLFPSQHICLGLQMSYRVFIPFSTWSYHEELF